MNLLEHACSGNPLQGRIEPHGGQTALSWPSLSAGTTSTGALALELR
jgi:hypothetical protein